MNEINVALVLMCGLPAAGKSTLCRALVAAASRRGGDDIEAVHIEFDAIIESVVDVSDDSGWRAARELVAVDVERRLEAHSDPSRMLMVFIDDNLYYESMRARFILAARRHAASLALLVVPTDDVELAVRRNAARDDESRRVPEHIIRRMAQRIDPPTAVELPFTLLVGCDPDDSNEAPLQFRLNDENESADRVLDQVLRVCRQVHLPSLSELAAESAQLQLQRDADRALVRENRRHRRELIARSLVGALVQSATNERRAAVARVLNACKRRVMDEATTDELESDDVWRATVSSEFTRAFARENESAERST
jgi:tRNA uridine 5-carbamoylmethylation protein Kti12